MRFAEFAFLQRPVSGGDRRLQNKEIAMGQRYDGHDELFAKRIIRLRRCDTQMP
jgi:hypothetical protein